MAKWDLGQLDTMMPSGGALFPLGGLTIINNWALARGEGRQRELIGFDVLRRLRFDSQSKRLAASCSTFVLVETAIPTSMLCACRMTTEVEAPQEAFGDYGKRAMAATSDRTSEVEEHGRTDARQPERTRRQRPERLDDELRQLVTCGGKAYLAASVPWSVN